MDIVLLPQRSPVLLLQLLFTLLLISIVPSSEASMVLPGCPSKCGNIEVPYPFAFNKACARDSTFLFTCNFTHYNPPELSLGNINVTGIDLTGHLDVLFFIARDCFNKTGSPLNTGVLYSDLRGNPFTISAERNRFTVTGCDTQAFIVDPDVSNGFSTGCASLCKSLSTIDNNTCSGIGCCQTSIPKGLKYYQATFKSFSNHRSVWNFNPCSLAFVVDQKKFEFNTSLLSTDYTYYQPKFPVVLDWAIEGEDCQKAKQNSTYACRSKNSDCFASPNGLGYLCNCSSGYQGNPYLDDGCEDIDECQNPRTYPCKGVCTNTPGSYNCTCALGSHSDDPITQNCIQDPKEQKLAWPLKLSIGLGCIIFVLAFVFCATYWGIQKKKLNQLKQKFFEQNGGLFLEQQISSDQRTGFRIFSKEELARATNNFDEDRILGKGGHGIVYKGLLDDNRTVAVKRSTMIDERNNKEFAREMLILSKINHKNVVKILGCCLEVEVPMLVYEFMPNGTLFYHIHEKKSEFLNSFDIRLRIAKEAADALAYLHSAASPPILHGDIKPSNILLDERYTAKVSDFGTSVLVPNDKEQFTTLVQGTCGYLDPEYLQTCQLTEKSDVYSFGVLLVELLTGRKALYFGGSKETQSTSLNFISCINNGRLLDILDNKIIKEECLDQVHKVSRIARTCLSLKGEERPTMKEVMMELETLQRSGKHPWEDVSLKDTESLLGERPEIYLLKEDLDFQRNNSSTGFTGLSIEQQGVRDVRSGR